MPRWKRLFDLVALTLIGLPAAVLVVLLVVLVLLVDGRPAFFRDRRVGRGGRLFGMLKLRTMRPGAADGAPTAGYKAQAVTRLGAWLRRWHLDELPQLWHVLRGEMSLVGPRPPQPGDVALAPKAYARLLDAPPGLTGLASVVVAGREACRLARARGAEEARTCMARTLLPRKLRLEAVYRARRSPGLDLAILVWTLLPRRRLRSWMARWRRRHPASVPGRGLRMAAPHAATRVTARRRGPGLPFRPEPRRSRAGPRAGAVPPGEDCGCGAIASTARVPDSGKRAVRRVTSGWGGIRRLL